MTDGYHSSAVTDFGRGGSRRHWEFILSILFGVVLLVAALAGSPTAHAGEYELSGSSRWVVLASRESLSEAIEIARDFRDAQVFKSENGWYAVAIGPIASASIDELRNQYSNPSLPDDAYLARGKNFVSRAWPKGSGGTTSQAKHKKGPATCRTCYVGVAWGFWNDADGGAHVATGVGYGSSYAEANAAAMRECLEAGVNCELTEEEGASNGGCAWVSVGRTSDGVKASVGSVKQEVFERCTRTADCNEPIGGCADRFPTD